MYFCIVDCEWDKWEIGLCSKTCGGGLRTNTRAEKVNANHGGTECSGSAVVEESCNVQECPGKLHILRCTVECDKFICVFTSKIELG